MLGIILAITAAFCWGTGAIFTRLGLQHLKTSTGTFLSMISSLLLIGTLALVLDFEAVTSLTPEALLWFGVIGLVNYVIGRQFNYMGIKHIGVAKAAPIFASAPLFAIILAVAFTGEELNISIVFGTLSIVVGLVLLITGR